MYFFSRADWKLGSPVLWTGQDGNVIVQGNVTALEPEKFLRFTVFDVRGEKPPVTDEDGITYELTEQDGKTLLKISQGDFSTMAEGEKYRDMSAEIWDRILAKVKELAEDREMGRGLLLRLDIGSAIFLQQGLFGEKIAKKLA